MPAPYHIWIQCISEKVSTNREAQYSDLNIADGGFNELLAANQNLSEWTMKIVDADSPYHGGKTLQQLSRNKKLTSLLTERWVGGDEYFQLNARLSSH